VLVECLFQKNVTAVLQCNKSGYKNNYSLKVFGSL
jgi:hypothetical protein